MFLGFIKFTNYGLARIPYPHSRINGHYGLFYNYYNKIYGNILTSKEISVYPAVKSYFVHIPNINGNYHAQYLWDRVYKFDSKMTIIERQKHVDDYFNDHYDKFQDVLAQIHPTGNLSYLTTNAIDLGQFIN